MLRNRAAVVTGSTSGTGLGITRALAGAGADVTLTGFRDAGAAERLRADLADGPGARTAYPSAYMDRTDQLGGCTACRCSDPAPQLQGQALATDAGWTAQ